MMAGLLAVLAWVSVRGSSSTFDEPLHAAAAVVTVAGDRSINPEHPPTWKYVAGLGLPGAEAVRAAATPEAMTRVRADPVAQWGWAVVTLYGGETPIGEELVSAARGRMVLFAVALVGVAAGLAHRLGGPVAAALAATLLALDPLLIGHATIVSSDVAVTLFAVAAVWCALELRGRSAASVGGAAAVGEGEDRRLKPPLREERGRGAHWGWGALLGVLLAATVTTKFTGLVVVPICVGVVLMRRSPRWGVAALAGVVMYVGVWGAYGFRYAATADGKLIDTAATAARVGQMRLLAEGKNPATTALPPADLPTRAVLAVERARLLPQPLTAGVLMSYAVTRSNPAFAAGRYSDTGWWWYFPFAAAVKTPVGLLAVWGVGGVLLWRRRLEMPLARVAVWALVPLGVATLASPLNIGLRHALPVLVPVSVLAATGVARAWGDGRVRRIALAAVGLMAAEVALARGSDLVSLFNLPARAIGPARLLGDSNLDWGQDLARLAEWRRANPGGTLYLAYWGTANPGAYGLGGAGVVHLPRTYEFAAGQAPADPSRPGYVAVSVTYLQGLNNGGVPAPFYRALLEREPEAEVGRTIRVWRYPMAPR